MLSGRGAAAVVLLGSVARGDAHAASDIDLIALGDGPEYHLDRVEGWLVSVSWRTAEAVRAAFDSPAQAGGAVPAWRGAVLLRDPRRLAEGLRNEALAWEWDRISDACDRWVAEQVTGFAEEAQRLVGHLRLRRRRAAAVIRGVLALQLPSVIAVHRRVLHDSENRLWDLVAEAEGADWAAAQDRALALDAHGEDEANHAALDMYTLAAAAVRPLLTAEQAAVVDGALDVIAGLPLGG